MAVGEGAWKVGESIVRGKAELERDMSKRQGDRPLVSTRRVSKGNPGALYGGNVRSASGQYVVLVTVLPGRLSHATYPTLQCASNLHLAGGTSNHVLGYRESVYLDSQGQCAASERVELTEADDGRYRFRTYSRGSVTSEGMIVPTVVPVPDAMVGTWQTTAAQKSSKEFIRVVLAQDGSNYTDFNVSRCTDRSLMAYEDSGRTMVSGYQEPSKCDNGGYVVFQQRADDVIERIAHAPDGTVTSKVALRRISR
jgi:hypothetical protein